MGPTGDGGSCGGRKKSPKGQGKGMCGGRGDAGIVQGCPNRKKRSAETEAGKVVGVKGISARVKKALKTRQMWGVTQAVSRGGIRCGAREKSGTQGCQERGGKKGGETVVIAKSNVRSPWRRRVKGRGGLMGGGTGELAKRVKEIPKVRVQRADHLRGVRKTKISERRGGLTYELVIKGGGRGERKTGKKSRVSNRDRGKSGIINGMRG